MTTGRNMWITLSFLVLVGNLVMCSEVNINKNDGRSDIARRWSDVSTSWGGNHGNVLSSGSGVSQYPKYTVPEYMLHPIPKNNGKQPRPTGKAMTLGSHGRVLHPTRSAWQTINSDIFPSSNSHFTGISRNNLMTSSWKTPAYSLGTNKQPIADNGISGVNYCRPCACEKSVRSHVTQNSRERFKTGMRNQKFGFQINQPLTSSLKLGSSLDQQVPLYYEIGKQGFGSNSETSTHSSGEVTR